jgi:hypothetical protein
MSELRRVEEKRRSDLTLNARLGRQDKANWRSLAPCGRKALSAHWFWRWRMAGTERARAGASSRIAMGIKAPSASRRTLSW